jgi:hypothetical protein
MKPFLAGSTLLDTDRTVSATATIDALMATDIGRTALATLAALSFFDIPFNINNCLSLICLFGSIKIGNLTFHTFFINKLPTKTKE